MTPNMPLEWTGHPRFPVSALELLPATQGQRYTDEAAVP